jgi:RNA polymerase subunit RPABC4/transcription elongation factor Spt4
MFDDLFGDFGQGIDDFVNSDAFQLGLRAIGVYIVLIWLASAFWAYRDMQLRSSNAVAPYLAAAVIVLFTPVFFIFALILYRIVRPKETIVEANDRALAEEAMLAEVQSRPHCANCGRPVHEEWIICPTCRNRLRRVCPNCERLIELDWALCAWCGKDFERAEAPGTAYMPPARRPRAGVPAPATVGPPGGSWSGERPGPPPRPPGPPQAVPGPGPSATQQLAGER